jgi:hypothetical protein
MTLKQLAIFVAIPLAYAVSLKLGDLRPSVQHVKLRMTESRLRPVQRAADAYLAVNPYDCPTIDDLKSSKFLAGHVWSQDRWHRPLDISCSGGRALVKSAGPDGELDTFDDVRPRVLDDR